MSFNGQALRQLRIEAGLTKQDLSEKIGKIEGHAGTSAAAVGYWEAGEWHPSGSSIQALSEIFGVPMLRFLMVPDALPIPRQLLSDLIEGLRHDDSRWCLGLLQGALLSLGYRVAFSDSKQSVIMEEVREAAPFDSIDVDTAAGKVEAGSDAD